jgi:hypothetical protein
MATASKRRRIPHGKLLKAGNVKAGMVVYHDTKWRTVHRAFFDGRDVCLYFSRGVGCRNPAIGRYQPCHLVAARITVREARIKQVA